MSVSDLFWFVVLILCGIVLLRLEWLRRSNMTQEERDSEDADFQAW